MLRSAEVDGCLEGERSSLLKRCSFTEEHGALAGTGLSFSSVMKDTRRPLLEGDLDS